MRGFSPARASFIAATLYVLAPCALAETAGPSGDTVVVVGRRPDNQLSAAPASITVIPAADVAHAGMVQLRDVANLTPDFSMLDNYRPGLERFQMRGIVTPQVGDPPVVFVVDGVTAPSPEFVTQPLFDVDRVEILRGAQGALYGRSAIGGAVYIVTHQPADRLEGNVSTSYANGDTRRISGVISGPVVSDKLRVRLGGYAAQSDGLIDNLFLKTPADYSRGQGWTGELLYTPDDRTSISLRAETAVSRDGIGYYDPVFATPASIEDFSIGVSQNVAGSNRRRLQNLSAKVEHRFDIATLTLTGSYARAKSDGVADADLTALPANGAGFAPSFQQAIDRIRATTLEARLVSTAKAPLVWALGAFYQERKGANTFSVFDDGSGGAVPVYNPDVSTAPQQFSIVDHNRSRVWAVSGEASYKFQNGFEADIAGRYDRDERQSVDPRDAATTLAKKTFDQFQPKATLSYHVNADTLFYASASRSFRSGGFNQYSPVVPRAYGAETTDGYEIGARLTRFDGRLSFSGALFRNEQKDAQITRFNPASFTLENVAIDRVRAQGGELDAALRPDEHVTLRLTYGYADSDIRRFTADPSVVGAAMPYVAKYNLGLGADYETPVGADLKLRGHIGYRRVGPRSYTLDFPKLRSEPHDIVDLRAGLSAPRWQLSAFADNLLDERQPEDLFGVFNGQVDLARQPNKGRTFGIELRYNFAAAN